VSGAPVTLVEVRFLWFYCLHLEKAKIEQTAAENAVPLAKKTGG
jgi:hypothetical protein